MALFERYIGIDYSGAQTPVSSLPGLRVYMASPGQPPLEIKAYESGIVPSKKHWSRRGIAEFLARELESGSCALVGIDHGFSFPISYFEKHSLAHDWHEFLDDFQQHWPTDLDHMEVDFIRNGIEGKVRFAVGIHAGLDWRSSVVRPNRCFILMCRDRSQSLLIRVFLGCCIYAGSWANGYTSGRLMAGNPQKASRSSPRFIPLYVTRIIPIRL